ncbi:uncharacterized protein BX664DRAFT_383364 [Halteromyces radiatus]|uniref:uncharacterized protein n=1 Tax=Halteromyces radiatus TaxID=101107 RepID=UPI00221F1A56|nr:uncharacterized protein BX664DRAFT_383364 [Halteromyces radiatus]KAI8097009.1 hypothetical protein BX664DRAFT_383364 [Halteromyces radiatus]
MIDHRDDGFHHLQVPAPVAINNTLSGSSSSIFHSCRHGSSSTSLISPLPFTHINAEDKKKNNTHRPLTASPVSPLIVPPHLEFKDTIEQYKHQLTQWQEMYNEQKEKTRQAEQKYQKLEMELEELTTSLFTEANQMVSKEKQLRVHAEQRLNLFQSNDNKTIDSPFLLEEFELFWKQLQIHPFEKIHQLPFMKACWEYDIKPCLQMSKNKKKKNDDEWVQTWLSHIVHHPCYIERIHDQKRKRRRRGLTETSWSSHRSAEICIGCQRPLLPFPAFRFRWTMQEPWVGMDHACRNRCVAVCNFYLFLRHIKQHLTTHRSLTSLYEESVQLRLEMHRAREKSS